MCITNNLLVTKKVVGLSIDVHRTARVCQTLSLVSVLWDWLLTQRASSYVPGRVEKGLVQNLRCLHKGVAHFCVSTSLLVSHTKAAHKVATMGCLISYQTQY